jgi:hypothetical protein
MDIPKEKWLRVLKGTRIIYRCLNCARKAAENAAVMKETQIGRDKRKKVGAANVQIFIPTLSTYPRVLNNFENCGSSDEYCGMLTIVVYRTESRKTFHQNLASIILIKGI